jgi:hypothetical protein
VLRAFRRPPLYPAELRARVINLRNSFDYRPSYTAPWARGRASWRPPLPQLDDLAYRKDVPAPPQATGEAAPEELPQTGADLPWGHHVVLLEKLKDPVERAWYAVQTVSMAGPAPSSFTRSRPGLSSELEGRWRTSTRRSPHRSQGLVRARERGAAQERRGSRTHSATGFS